VKKYEGVSQAKEWINEYLFGKSLAIIEDYCGWKQQEGNNQVRILTESKKQLEEDILRYKNELTQEKESSFKKLQEQENERIQKRTENAILTEKVASQKAELDRMVALEV